MATEYANIDDVLVSGKTATQPEAPEHQYEDHLEMDAPEEAEIPKTDFEPQNYDTEPEPEPEPKTKEPEQDFDEYGNAKAKAKMYSEDEVNDRINKAVRERLERLD